MNMIILFKYLLFDLILLSWFLKSSQDDEDWFFWGELVLSNEGEAVVSLLLEQGFT